jgi:TonB family protein
MSANAGARTGTRVLIAAICSLILAIANSGPGMAQGPNWPTVHTTKNDVSFTQGAATDNLPLKTPLMGLLLARAVAGTDACGGLGNASAGVTVLTPTAGADFSPYLSLAVRRIRKNWYAAMPNEVYLGSKGCVVVDFAIMQNGVLSDPDTTIVHTTGDQRLDEAALKAIRDSVPYPPLPDAFKGGLLRLRFSFRYNISN